MDSSLAGKLFAALNILVAERQRAGSFRLIEPLPDFAGTLLKAAITSDGLLEDFSEHPFLAHFIEDAEAFWARGTRGATRGGPWIETDDEETEHPLMVFAVNVGEKHFLLIELLGVDYEDRRAALQSARQQMLDERSARRKAQEAVVESEERYKQLFEQSTDAICVVGPDGIITDANPSCGALFGAEPHQLLGMEIQRFYANSADRAKIRQRLETHGAVTNYSWEVRRTDGTLRQCLLNVSPCRDRHYMMMGFITMARDVTEKMRLEERLRQSEKMESLGTLAGGIAHDFNNILNAIIGFTELAVEEVPDESGVHDDLEEVLAAAGRATDLVGQILAFSRKHEQEKVVINLSSIVKEVLRLLRASLPSTIELRKSMKAQESTVMADPTHIHQVIMNLCTNAHHAMREKGGILETALETVTLEADSEDLDADMTTGRYVKLTVRDTGHGIPAEVVDRIFEPYFTTKKRGEGTGLGLAVVHGIVKSHGGSIRVESAKDTGTTVTVFLPLVQKTAEAEKFAARSLPRGSERILFVDDERPLVVFAKRSLERLGYTVAAATDGFRALEKLRRDPDAFDLIVTDLSMPKMTGMELAKEVRGMGLELPVVLVTGFSDQTCREEMRELGIRLCVTKPLGQEKLANVVRDVLDG